MPIKYKSWHWKSFLHKEKIRRETFPESQCATIFSSQLVSKLQVTGYKFALDISANRCKFSGLSTLCAVRKQLEKCHSHQHSTQLTQSIDETSSTGEIGPIFYRHSHWRAKHLVILCDFFEKPLGKSVKRPFSEWNPAMMAKPLLAVNVLSRQLRESGINGGIK